MGKPIDIEEVLPVYKVEQNCIISKQGDITLAYEVSLPEIFTLSNPEYEAIHHTLIKAIKILPRHTIFHKQDWFVEDHYRSDFSKKDVSFLSRASEKFFHERPYLDHRCFVMLTKKAQDRKTSNSFFSNLLRRSFVPPETIRPEIVEDFMDSAGQFERILQDSGFLKLRRLTDDDLAGNDKHPGLLEKYCYLLTDAALPVIKDIHINDELKIGDHFCQLYTLADVEDLPSLCGARINYDKYSTDKTKFSISFASPLGQLLACNHIYNQFIFIDDAQKTIKQLESKRLRLQSLSAYSRENAISKDATNDFLNEAISQQRMPVKASFNVLVWTDQKDKLKELKTIVSSALSQMDAATKQETDGAPQIFWAGLPGNEADFPMNDTFDTFAEQAACFLNLESNYRSSVSPVGLRLGDRLTGQPLHVDISDEPVKNGTCTNHLSLEKI